MGLRDPDADNIARADLSFIYIDATIYFRCLVACPPHEQKICFLAHSLNQNRLNPAYRALIDALADCRLRAHHHLIPSFLFLCADLVRQLVSLALLLVLVGEYAHMGQFPSPEKINKLFYILFGLTGKTNEKGCPNGTLGQMGSNAAEQRFQIVSAVPPVHPPEDPVTDMLEGDIKIRNNAWRRGHQSEELISGG